LSLRNFADVFKRPPENLESNMEGQKIVKMGED